MARTPSLRELRRNCPGNVAILPTASARQVQQRYGRGYSEATDELIAGQAATFSFKFPGEREAERLARRPELRADVPPFDPSNPAHLRAWEAILDAGRSLHRSDRE